MTKTLEDGWRTRPAYTIGQAARLTGTSSATVRRWLYGYEAPGHRMAPVFGRRTRKDSEPAVLSFLDLAELLVVAAFRRRGVTLERVRRAHAFARNELGVAFPFAHLKLRTDGRYVLSEFQKHEPGEGLLVSLDRAGLLALPGGVLHVLDSFDFESDFAARWYPLGHDVPIVVDPRYGAGRPTIPTRGVTVETLYKRWKAGQTITFIARDYRIDKAVVESALWHADQLAA